MRNYIIINGVNSLSIKGLAITKLPSIYKPIMRTEIEEIDGRNGDIITELGYGAYNKELTVGLFGDYNIDEIIAFFNQKGTIIFSNENDKVYNFDIVDQIEFERLIKFRSATINIHCQPFKYPLSETPIEVEYEYVTGEGENITLNDTDNSALELDLKGNTSQTGTPTPSSPIPVNVVSGDNEIIINSKNQLETYNISGTLNGVNYTLQDGVLTLNGTCTSTGGLTGLGIFRQIKGINYKWTYVYESGTCTDYGGGLYMGATPTSMTSAGYGAGFRTSQSRTVATFNNGEEHTYYLYMAINNNSTFTNYKIKPLIVQGNEYSYDFEPYIGNTYNIDLPVENLCDVILDSSISGDMSYKTYTFKPNTQYTISTNTWVTSSSTANIFASAGTSFSPSSATNGVNGSRTITSDSNGKITIGYRNVNLSLDYSSGDYYVQIEEGSKANSYTPYGTTPIELCKIGNYQDYFYKDSDKWYLHKEIGKIVLDGTQNITLASSGTRRFNATYTTLGISNVKEGTSAEDTTLNYRKCDHFIYSAGQNTWGRYYLYNNWLVMLDSDSTIASANDLKIWLENNNTSIYYVLSTPTNTEITYQPLIEQLNALELAQSKENQTNISQVNNDLPFIISASTLKKGSDTASIVNDGNIYSKPLIDIEGTGLVTIYLDNTQMFQVDLSELNNITIDTELLEAYSDTQLANRKVVGDYSKFKLQVGTSQLKFGGALTKATITRYKRWL